jgi:hypothetical protein
MRSFIKCNVLLEGAEGIISLGRIGRRWGETIKMVLK